MSDCLQSENYMYVLTTDCIQLVWLIKVTINHTFTLLTWSPFTSVTSSVPAWPNGAQPLTVLHLVVPAWHFLHSNKDGETDLNRVQAAHEVVICS